jgi:hypothetical protein
MSLLGSVVKTAINGAATVVNKTVDNLENVLEKKEGEQKPSDFNDGINAIRDKVAEFGRKIEQSTTTDPARKYNISADIQEAVSKKAKINNDLSTKYTGLPIELKTDSGSKSGKIKALAASDGMEGAYQIVVEFDDKTINSFSEKKFNDLLLRIGA